MRPELPSFPNITKIQIWVYRSDGSLQQFDFDGHGHVLSVQLESVYAETEEVGGGVWYQDGLSIKTTITATQGSGPHPLLRVTKKEPNQ